MSDPLPIRAVFTARSRLRREKLFGDGRPMPLDRNAKVRIKIYARTLMRRTEEGKHYGAITAKAYAVLEALLWHFHNARTGVCFPSLETIAEAAGCARSTVAEAIKSLEQAGLLTWVHRIKRIRERCEDLFGQMGTRTRVVRTSNAYSFVDPKGAANRPFSSKSDYPSGTSNQGFIPLNPTPAKHAEPASPALMAALERLGNAIRDRKDAGTAS